jgi:hypothetical protein
MNDILDSIIAEHFSGNRVMAEHLLGHIVHFRDGLITRDEMAAHIVDTLYGCKAPPIWTQDRIDADHEDALRENAELEEAQK